MKKAILTLAMALSLGAALPMMAREAIQQAKAERSENEEAGSPRRPGKKMPRRQCALTPCVDENTCGNPQCRPGQTPCCPPGSEKDCFSLRGKPSVCPEGNECDTLCPASADERCPGEGYCVPGPERGEGGCWQRGCFQPGSVPPAPCSGAFTKQPGECSLMEGISLTPAQQAKMDRLKEKKKENRAKMREKYSKERKALREKEQKARKKEYEKMEKETLDILTPEQKQVYLQNRQKLQEEREQHRKGFRRGEVRPGGFKKGRFSPYSCPGEKNFGAGVRTTIR